MLACEWDGIIQQRSFFIVAKPQHSFIDEKFFAPAQLILFPELQRTHIHIKIKFIIAVGGPDHPRLVAGAAPGIACTPRIDQRHFQSHPHQ
ncbi:MAG: hypothetical protein WDN75_11145 [Bacteroidota bacterium]